MRLQGPAHLPDAEPGGTGQIHRARRAPAYFTSNIQLQLEDLPVPVRASERPLGVRNERLIARYTYTREVRCRSARV